MTLREVLIYDELMSLEDIQQERVAKLDALKKKGINPYPSETGRKNQIAETLTKFQSLSKLKRSVVVAGRLMGKREHGRSAFADIYDGSAKLQLYFKKDVLNDNYDFFGETVDVGDFIEVTGKLFKTKKEEKTLEVAGWKMLAKSLMPLPEKWHGLQDVEERFRKRYLDILMNEGVKERFERRSRIITILRLFLEKRSFLEVETPMLQPIPGGALAKPFITHHNALDTDLYLRIAPELYLKRLLVGGFERIYEIGRNFRNEGIDHDHNPEFTMLECYAAYWDEYDMMNMVEDLFVELNNALVLSKKINTPDDKSPIIKKPFPRIAFKELLRRYAQIIDYNHETRSTLVTRAKQLGIEVGEHESKARIADEIYKKICRPHLIQPTFVIDHPLEISPLAKQKIDMPDEVRRFQLVVAGLELANAFAELNDPVDQRQRMEAQDKERAGGEEEAHRTDEDFIEALEYGMPPAAGLGIGIDRLVMFLTDTKNIKEVILFPTMRSKQ